MSFNRSELVRALYEHFGARSVEAEGPRLKRRDEAERLVSCLLDEIAGALERGKVLAEAEVQYVASLRPMCDCDICWTMPRRRFAWRRIESVAILIPTAN
jgi:hypothetical protein